MASASFLNIKLMLELSKLMSGYVPAIYVQCDSCCEVVHGQVIDCPCNSFRFSDTVEQMEARQSVGIFYPDFFLKRSTNNSRSNGIYPDVIFPELGRQLPGQGMYRS